MDEQGQENVSLLLVDDEENILRALQRLLMDEEDLDVTTATSGEEGLNVLPTINNLGVIISDQRMPGMNGAVFLEKAREIVPDASRIILTGYADVTAAVDAINKGGAWRYLAKPWNDEDLIRVIREGVDRYRMIMENRRLNALVLQQKKELEEWNEGLKQRVMSQTVAIRKQNDELRDLLAKVNANYSAIISSFAGLVELHGGKLRQHSHNVAELAVNAARELGITGEELETIRIAGLLHDIGKIGIPGRILMLTTEAMKPDELRQYRQHSVRGQVAIDAIEDLRPAGVFIRHHHENYDGSGFPDGLAGENIPLGARIIAFADYLDKSAESFTMDIADKALATAGFAAEKQLDPMLQRVFRKVAKYTYNTLDERLGRKESYSTSIATGQHIDPGQRSDMVLLEIKPENLRDGMFLAEDVRSESGMLLLRKGLNLDKGMIQAIHRYYEIDAPPHGDFVKVPRTAE